MTAPDPTAGERAACRYVMHAPGDPCDCKARLGQVVTHTRTSTNGNGPDYCAECSAAISEWVPWPCTDAASPPAVAASTGTSEDLEALLCLCHQTVCPVHNEAAGRVGEYDVPSLLDAIGSHVAAREAAARAEALRTVAADMVWDFDDHPVTRAAVREWLNGQAAQIAREVRP